MESIKKQYRWIIIYYHAGTEQCRIHGHDWFQSIKQCEADADENIGDYCCGYRVEVQERETGIEVQERGRENQQF